MKSYGPDLPPRNPAAAAREAARFHRWLMFWLHVRLQARAALEGLLETMRIAGVVLIVNDITGVHDASMWLAAALIAAPLLAALSVLAIVFVLAKWRSWRTLRAVR